MRNNKLFLSFSFAIIELIRLNFHDYNQYYAVMIYTTVEMSVRNHFVNSATTVKCKHPFCQYFNRPENVCRFSEMYLNGVVTL